METEMDIELELVVNNKKEDIKKDLKGGVSANTYEPNWFKATEHRPVIGEYVWVYVTEDKTLVAVEWCETLEDSSGFAGVYWQPVDAPKLPEFDEFYSE